MPEYRIYLLDHAGRIRAPAIDAECADDNAALALARQSIPGGEEAEVWAGVRCLGRAWSGAAEVAAIPLYAEHGMSSSSGAAALTNNRHV